MSLTCDLAAVHAAGLDIYKFSHLESKSLGEPTVHPIISGSSVKIFKYSHRGHLFCCSTGLKTCLYDGETLALQFEVQNKTCVTECFFSPNDSFVCVGETFHPQENPNNIKIYRISDATNSQSSITLSLLFSFQLRTGNSAGLISFSFDDRLFSRLENGKLLIYDSQKGTRINLPKADNLGTISSHILMGALLGGDRNVSVEAGLGGIAVGCFMRGAAGNPSMFRVFKLTDFSRSLCQKACFNADDVEFSVTNWGSERGTGALNKSNVRLLLSTLSHHDASGKSYYGQSSLYFFSIAISSSSCLLDCRVDYDKEGSVHAHSWSPDGNEFLVLYGLMPSKGVIFNSKCQAQHPFGEISRNACGYNQNGSLFYMGGFGNLAGYIDVWHRRAMKKLSSFQEPGTTLCEWMSDGTHLVTATLSPRLRVDNGFKVFNVMGQRLYTKPYAELFGILVRPFKFEIPSLSVEECQARTSPLLESKAVKKAAAYVPPALRKQLAEESVSNASSIQSQPVSNTQSIKSQSVSGNQSGQAEPVKLLPEIKIRNLTKKLEDIAVLKQKLQEGQNLNQAQREKIKREPTIIAELAAFKVQTCQPH